MKKKRLNGFLDWWMNGKTTKPSIRSSIHPF